MKLTAEQVAKDFADFLTECNALVAQGPSPGYSERVITIQVWDNCTSGGGETVDGGIGYDLSPEESACLLSALSHRATEQGAEWIPVSERLPEEGSRVLVRRGDEPLYNPCIAKYTYTTGIGETWYYEPDFVGMRPTHWMPLHGTRYKKCPTCSGAPK